MPEFSYTARDRSGERRQGSLDAKDRRLAVAALQRQGLTPIQVKEASSSAPAGKKTQPKAKNKPSAPTAKKKPAPKGLEKQKKIVAKAGFSFGAKKMRLRDVLQFSTDLRDLLGAGMTLGTCVQKLSQQGDTAVRREILGQVHEDIVQGKSLSDALAKHPKSFPEFYVSVVRAGEAGGQLQQALDNIVMHFERVQETRSQVVAALAYPMIVAVFGVITIIACLVFVIPNFVEIFADLGQNLPAPTRFLMTMSDILRQYGLLVFGLFALVSLGFSRWVKTPSGRYSWHAFKLKVPVFKRVVQSGAYANFARTLSNLLTNGVPVLSALTIVENTVGNDVLARQVESVRARVTDGASLSKPLAESGVFPVLFTDMLSVGEESGQVPRSLGHIARRYDDELKRDLKLFTTVLEPLLMIFIAGGVAFVAISMLLPVFQLTQGLQN